MKATAIHPIIYVRGYAMTPKEIEETVADPYMGFNIGSAKIRQLVGRVKKYFVESRSCGACSRRTVNDPD